MADNVETIAAAAPGVVAELEQAQDVVRTLANDLAEVADVIEPILADQAQRIRRARMTVIEECQQTARALKEFRDVLTSPGMGQAVDRAERFLVVCRELEEFRACGFLDSFLGALFTSQDKHDLR